jgi:serine/threonine protein kinase
LAELEQRIIAQDPDLPSAGPTGRKLRDYELGERIGANDYAVVYRGTQPSMNRDVAIKVIRPDLANQPDFIHRFEAEAQRIDREGTLPVMAAIRRVEEIGGALTIAHRAGIVHRDVRPANIVFDESGNAYLTDFGIAVRSLTVSDHTTAELGTSSVYSSPEQREHGMWSPRSDIYILGMVIQEALVGAPPARPSDDWSPDPVRPGIPEAVDAALRRACASDPADRFADMAAFVVAVRAAGSFAGTSPDLDRDRDEFLGLELERVNPYKGLRAFVEGDSKDFFGRDSWWPNSRQAWNTRGSSPSSDPRARASPRW